MAQFDICNVKIQMQNEQNISHKFTQFEQKTLINYYHAVGLEIKKVFCDDRDRTRTCNPQIRSLMPYPLGHTATSDIAWLK